MALPPPLALGLLAALPLLAIMATLRTIIDTGLRLSVSPGTLRNLQAVMGVVAVLFLYLGMSPGMSASSYVIGLGAGPARLGLLAAARTCNHRPDRHGQGRR